MESVFCLLAKARYAIEGLLQANLRQQFLLGVPLGNGADGSFVTGICILHKIKTAWV